MASEAEKLRAVAVELRKEAARRDEQKAEKCAQVLVAAVGLNLLRSKVMNHG